MKSALPPSLELSVRSLALLLPALCVVVACGSEAPLPVIGNMSGAPATTGGNTVTTTGGMSGAVSASGSAVMPTGGSGTSGSSVGGTAQGGASTAGTAGAVSGGAGTSGSSAAGSGGAMGGAAAGGSAGAGASLLDVAAQLDGAMLLGKCLNDTAASVCQTAQNGCPPANQADPALSGAITTDKTLTLAGDPGKTYTITLHVQGEVESKRYNGGVDQNAAAQSPKADGFCTGGTPSNENAYNVYMVRVSSPKQDYFLNSLQGPGVSNHTTYGIDYVAKIQANGGATLRLVAADSNCSMIKNCGPMENSGNVCSQPITLQNMDPKASAKNPAFDFSKPYNGQWIVMVVTDVTQN